MTFLSLDSVAEFPEAVRLGGVQLFWSRHCFVKGLRSELLYSPTEVRPLPKSKSAAQNLRRSGGDRHRECAAIQEIQERNAELREALEHQTATAEVLGIISRSPTDVQPVLDAIVESAARVCGIDDVLLRLREGNIWISRAHFGSIPIRRVEISIDEPRFHWMREHGTLHIPDVREQNEFPVVPSETGAHLLVRSASSAGRTHWNAGCTSH